MLRTSTPALLIIALPAPLPPGATSVHGEVESGRWEPEEAEEAAEKELREKASPQ